MRNYINNQRGAIDLILVIGAMFIIGTGIYAYAQAKTYTKPETSTESSKPEETKFHPAATKEAPTKNSVTAEYLTDFKIVCSGGKVTNSQAYSGASPHPMLLLKKGLVKDSYTQSSVSFTERSWSADYKNPSATQLVGCLERKSETLVKVCKFKQASAELYSVVYTLNIYEAKTGKKLGTHQVNGPAGECPVVAYYDKNDPKIFAEADKKEVTAAVQSYITK